MSLTAYLVAFARVTLEIVTLADSSPGDVARKVIVPAAAAD